MPRILGENRGTFFLEHMEFNDGSVWIGGKEGLGSEKNEFIVQDFSFVDQEKNSIIQCFDNVNHVYAFGHDPDGSVFSVTFLVFLGGKCSGDGECGEAPSSFKLSGSLGKLLEKYKGLKVSKGATVKVLFANDSGAVLVGIVLSAAARMANPELNLVAVTISGKSMYLV